MEDEKRGAQVQEPQGSCCNDSNCSVSILPFKRSTEKVGLNDACPCESGRKYKKCCGKWKKHPQKFKPISVALSLLFGFPKIVGLFYLQSGFLSFLSR